jgi:hypothetical protein
MGKGVDCDSFCEKHFGKTVLGCVCWFICAVVYQLSEHCGDDGAADMCDCGGLLACRTERIMT